MHFSRRLRANYVVRFAAYLPLAYLILTSVLEGWRKTTTDFPNYYTAAVALREGKHLRDFYDWTWFQRQMSYAGFEQQLGAYTPQTPLTMLPIVPLSTLPPQTAKRIWLLANVGFLLGTIEMLRRSTSCRVEIIALVAFSGYTSIKTNLLLGQYYIFLLFLFTSAFYLLTRRRDAGAGIVSGVAFALKLYGGPLLLCFVALRRWRCVTSMIVAAIVAVIVGSCIFGWQDILFYLREVLPRTLGGGSVDPYNPANPTLWCFLRRLFLVDPDLNPHPLLNQPYLFFFLQSFVGPAILVISALAVSSKRPTSAEDAVVLFVLASMLISASVASYTYVLLLLPVAIMVGSRSPLVSCYAVCSCVLLNAPLRGASLFPKVWLLSALLIVAGRGYWAMLQSRVTAVATAILAVFAYWTAGRQFSSFMQEPSQRYELIRTRKGSLFSASPGFHDSGMFYQSMGRDRYVLSWKVNEHIEDVRLDGNVFRPAVPDPSGPVYFELVKDGQSRNMMFDPATRRVSPSSIFVDRKEIVSPDHNWIAFTSTLSGTSQVYVRRLPGGDTIWVSGGNCNSWDPVWELDGKTLAFASDCGRALGLPRLYRARIPVAAVELKQ